MRRAAHEALTKRAVQNYHPIQTKEATILASSLLSPSGSDGLGLEKQFHRLAASTILSIVYDYPTLESIDDPILEQIEAYNLRISHAVTPGSFYVDFFPWMMYIPERSRIYFHRLTVYIDARYETRFAKWKREGLQQFTKDLAMFKGLLNRVRVDLVRSYPKRGLWSPIDT
jgi:hypothetical protein